MSSLIKSLQNMDMAALEKDCRNINETKTLDFSWNDVIAEPVGLDLLVAVADKGHPIYGLPDKDGKTVLEALAKRGNINGFDLVYPLIGDPLDQVVPAMQEALSARSSVFIERLIKKTDESDLSALDIGNDTLVEIFKLGVTNKNICDFCVRMGVDFNAMTDQQPMAAWMIKHPFALPYLFASDADLSVKLKDNSSLLHLMAGSPNFKSTSQANINAAIEKLLAAGVGVNDKNDKDRTALFYAADAGQATGKSFVMTLIENDADLQASASYDGTVTAEEYIIAAWGEAAYAAISRAKLDKQMLASEQTLDEEIAEVSTVARRGRRPTML